MARGGSRVGAGRPKSPDSRRSRQEAKRAEKGKPPAKAAETKKRTVSKVAALHDEQQDVPHTEPLAYMLQVMNDPEADPGRRDRMAVAAAPYMHPKVGEGGKKEQRSAAAKTAGAGRFAPAAPPKLVVSNR